MKLIELQHKKILIVGKGIEGNSAAQFLARWVPSAKITSTAQEDGENYLDIQKKFDLAVRSPGVRKELLTIPYTTPTNIFFANTQGIVLGVTGSKGKSTTASLLSMMLREEGLPVRLVGNIGKPMLDALSDELVASFTTPFYYVVELSSYQLDDILYAPHIAVITTLHPDHMDYHGGMERYITAKCNIIAHMHASDYYVFNDAIPELVRFSHATSARAIPFLKQLPFPDSAIKLLGKHNKDNVRAAATAAALVGVSPRTMERAAQAFAPLPHRLERVGEFHGITFYDDAISTAPESTLGAIEALPRLGTIILGGTDRGYDFCKLAKALAKICIPNIVLFPESGAQIKKCLQMYKEYHPMFFETSSMEEAVRFAYAHTPRGTICLLSTASPSYSLWKNFEEKGTLFKLWTTRLGKSRTYPKTTQLSGESAG